MDLLGTTFAGFQEVKSRNDEQDKKTTVQYCPGHITFSMFTKKVESVEATRASPKRGNPQENLKPARLVPTSGSAYRAAYESVQVGGF